jgi:predicted XRE-type DNA-binding protein
LKDGEDVHHINEDKEDNVFENLIMMPESEHSSFHSTGKQHSEKTRNKMSESHLNTKGENSPNHKLTEEQVIQIKLLLKEGILTQQEIADRFGVSRLTISAIKTGRRWNHITMEIL